MYIFLRIISDIFDKYLWYKTLNELFSLGLTATLTHFAHS